MRMGGREELNQVCWCEQARGKEERYQRNVHVQIEHNVFSQCIPEVEGCA